MDRHKCHSPPMVERAGTDFPRCRAQKSSRPASRSTSIRDVVPSTWVARMAGVKADQSPRGAVRVTRAHESGHCRTEPVCQAHRRLLPARVAEQFADAGSVEIVEEERKIDEMGGTDPAVERRRRPGEFVVIGAAAGGRVHGGKMPGGLGPAVLGRNQMRQRDLVAAAFVEHRSVERLGLGPGGRVVKVPGESLGETARRRRPPGDREQPVFFACGSDQDVDVGPGGKGGH